MCSHDLCFMQVLSMIWSKNDRIRTVDSIRNIAKPTKSLKCHKQLNFEARYGLKSTVTVLLIQKASKTTDEPDVCDDNETRASSLEHNMLKYAHNADQSARFPHWQSAASMRGFRLLKPRWTRAKGFNFWCVEITKSRQSRVKEKSLSFVNPLPFCFSFTFRLSHLLTSLPTRSFLSTMLNSLQLCFQGPC